MEGRKDVWNLWGFDEYRDSIFNDNILYVQRRYSNKTWCKVVEDNGNPIYSIDPVFINRVFCLSEEGRRGGADTWRILKFLLNMKETKVSTIFTWYEWSWKIDYTHKERYGWKNYRLFYLGIVFIIVASFMYIYSMLIDDTQENKTGGSLFIHHKHEIIGPDGSTFILTRKN